MEETKDQLDRLRRTIKSSAEAAYSAIRHIQALERQLKDQKTLRDKIQQLETTVAKHATAISDRNKVVEATNRQLHLARLEIVKLKREITGLRSAVRLLTDGEEDAAAE